MCFYLSSFDSSSLDELVFCIIQQQWRLVRHAAVQSQCVPTTAVVATGVMTMAAWHANVSLRLPRRGLRPRGRGQDVGVRSPCVLTTVPMDTDTSLMDVWRVTVLVRNRCPISARCVAVSFVAWLSGANYVEHRLFKWCLYLSVCLLTRVLEILTAEHGYL